MIRVRPSKLKMIARCNGSAALEEWLREQGIVTAEDEEVAKLGTLMHELTAAMVKSFILIGHDYRPDFQALREGWLKEHDELNGYDVWMVFSSFLWLRSLIDQEGVELENILVEHHMDGADLGMSEGGTADIVLVIPFKKVIVIDWKFGFIEQDVAEINDQLAGYGVMASRTFTVDEVDVYIFQPRQEEAESSARYDAQLLKDAEAWVREQCDLAQQPDAALNYDYGACFYCEALGRCPESRSKIMDILEAFEKIGAETDADLYEIYRAAKLYNKAAENLKKEIKPKLEKDPHCIPGLSLTEGRKVNEVLDPESLHSSMEAASLNFWDCATVGITKLKKVLPNKSEMLNYIVETGRQAPSIKVS